MDDGDKWRPDENMFLNGESYEKYKGELYGVSRYLTQEASKNIVGGMWTPVLIKMGLEP